MKNTDIIPFDALKAELEAIAFEYNILAPQVLYYMIPFGRPMEAGSTEFGVISGSWQFAPERLIKYRAFIKYQFETLYDGEPTNYRIYKVGDGDSAYYIEIRSTWVKDKDALPPTPKQLGSRLITSYYGKKTVWNPTIKRVYPAHLPVTRLTRFTFEPDPTLWENKIVDDGHFK